MVRLKDVFWKYIASDRDWETTTTTTYILINFDPKVYLELT